MLTHPWTCHIIHFWRNFYFSISKSMSCRIKHVLLPQLLWLSISTKKIGNPQTTDILFKGFSIQETQYSISIGIFYFHIMKLEIVTKQYEIGNSCFSILSFSQLLQVKVCKRLKGIKNVIWHTYTKNVFGYS